MEPIDLDRLINQECLIDDIKLAIKNFNERDRRHEDIYDERSATIRLICHIEELLDI